MACDIMCREKFSKMHFLLVVLDFGEKNEYHICAEQRTDGVCGGGGLRQGHHSSALLLSIVALAGYASKQIFLKIVYD